MRFVDWVGFLDGGDFDESKHPRGDDGKFSNSPGGAGAPKFKQKIRDLKQRLRNGERPRDILKEAAGLLEGEYECEFPDGEKATLVFDNDFKKESGKYFTVDPGTPTQGGYKTRTQCVS